MNSLEDLKMGDHVAFFYRDPARHLQIMMHYIQQGLQKKQRCLYIVDDVSVASILRHMEQAGINVEQEQSRGALHVTTKAETYLRHGVFEPEKVVAGLKEEIRKSLAMGFTGLRASGEMTWALDLPSAVSSLLHYEMMLNVDYPSEFIALCQYDETRFSSTVVENLAAIHPVVIRRGKLIRHSPKQEESLFLAPQSAGAALSSP